MPRPYLQVMRFPAKMWLQLMVGLVLGGAAASVQCPDGRACEDPYTCCLLSQQGGYACCTQSQLLGTPLPRLPPSGVNEGSSALCPEQHSCLHTVDASFGCCPWEKAISCADGRHCCPLGSHCSVDGKSCFQHEVLTGATVIGAVPCPDGESECPNDSTCCLMPDGAWGCCPMPEAACCADKIHCCPHGTTCDLSHARCYAPSGTLPLLKKFPAIKQVLRMGQDSLSLSSVSAAVKGPLEGNICKRNNSACPDSATCCLLPVGQYGCCPLQNAVCCSDHLHCCPQGTQCDLTHSRCTMTSRWSWPLTRLLVDPQRAADVQCDAEHKCPDDNTCCPQGSSSWGCCPLVEAVCCADGTHCCPKGYACNLSEGSCLKESKSLVWLVKMDPPLPEDSRESACCQDGPRCDPSQGGCVKDRESVPRLEESPALVSLSRDVKCDEEFSCPDQQTCCRMKSGAWACCPFSEATCCKDGLHCCPSGYRCDLSQGSCVKGWESVPWLEKKLAVVSLSRDVKCDDEFSCPEGQTCCQMKLGAWACCPFLEAVCCEDHQHCCPSGYTCNVAAQTCEKRQEAWLLPSGELLASSLVATSGQDVSCDPQHYCHDRQTCCKASSGGWACCPYEKGSCCTDRRHCCPPGFRCSHSGFECIKQKPLQWATNVLPADSAQEHNYPLL